MSFRIERNIKGTTYVYEVENYWNKEKKQSRQKKKLIGKRDPKTNEIIPTGKNRDKIKIKDLGSIYFLEEIYKKLGLVEIIEKEFFQYKEILSMVSFLLSEHNPIYLAQDWFEACCSQFKTIDLSSQRVSELFERIGNSPDKKFNFFRNWIKENKPTDTIFYDITSISSYSEKLDIAEMGYNRDKENLRQINLGIIYGGNNHLPLLYNFHQGSISDVASLNKAIEMNKELGLTNIIYIMDRGFYSQRNLKDLIDEKIIIPVPYSTNLAKQMVVNNENELSCDENLICYNEHLYYHFRQNQKINNTDYSIHVFRDKMKYEIRETEFYKEIFQIESKLKTIEYKIETIEEDLKLIAKKKFKYFKIERNENSILVTRNKEEIKKAKQRFGTVVYLTNCGDLKKDEIIKLQKDRDDIEKVFNSMKNDINQNRLRVNNRNRIDGKLFVIFISLVVNSYIENIRKSSKDLKKKTKNEIFYELKKIKAVQYSNNFIQIPELSKKAKDIFKAYNIEIPKNLT